MCWNVFFVTALLVGNGWVPDPDLSHWKRMIITDYSNIRHYRIELHTEGFCVKGVKLVRPLNYA